MAGIDRLRWLAHGFAQALSRRPVKLDLRVLPAEQKLTSYSYCLAVSGVRPSARTSRLGGVLAACDALARGVQVLWLLRQSILALGADRRASSIHPSRKD